ncbi:uncharacterized protein BJ171DRAFT_499828 [Polychytrium aggregatum]|uniref:uncharacterized protein n=1 Tax=Polychytrium aggregatum TaxID=110093 RepID=UPI0022FED815|nr:uncharacterized protein BJ171DRAFT_499828 [Polychytrium aggregatum]KAI9205825.1 hypothetical protein BJ171DRAFT_499828 [Polychytrium aggregatum]
MARRSLPVLITALVCLVLASCVAADRYVVVFRSGSLADEISEASAKVVASGGSVVRRLKVLPAIIIDCDPSFAENTIQNWPSVDYIEKDEEISV